MHKLLRPSVTMLVAVVALSFALVGSAVAGPSAAKITTAKVKKIVKKQIAKAAPKLSVKNAGTVGGKTVGQIKTVLAGSTNASVVNDIENVDKVMVSVSYTLAAPSTVHVNGVAELEGDGTDGDEAECFIKHDGGSISSQYDASFPDLGVDNAAVIGVLATATNIAAGPHVATLVCNQTAGTGTVAKDDASIQITAVPN